MADQLHVQVVTPDRTFYNGEVTMVELTTTEGNIGVLRGHIPLTAVSVPGTLKLHGADGMREAALMSGFLMILPEKVTILTEAAEWPEEIDVKRAQQARERADRYLKSPDSGVDFMRAEAALRRALLRERMGSR